jgi:hypothetical protein
MLALTKRGTLGRPRTFAEDDGNLDVIASSLNIAPQYIGQSYVPVTRLSDNTSDDTVWMVMASIPLPAVMGPNSMIKIIPEWGLPSTDTKIVRIMFGGSEISAITLTTTIENKFLIEVQNLGSLGQQGIFNGSSYAATTNARISTTVDTSIPQTIEFMAKWTAAVSAKTITLRGYSIVHFPGVA